MDWYKMKIFYYVAKYKSFAEAGVARNISASALSKVIRQFEYELKCQLFQRHARGIVLTEVGEKLFSHAAMVYEKSAIIEDAVTSSKTDISGVIRFQSTQGFISHWLIDYLIDFKIKHPALHLLLSGYESHPELDLGKFDVAVRPFLPNRPDLVQDFLADYHLVLYGSENYLKEHGTPKNVLELDHHQLLAYGSMIQNPFGDSDWHLKAGMPHGLTRAPVFSSNSSYNLFKAAEAGLGLVVLPKGYPSLQGSSLMPVLPEEALRTESYCIYPQHLKEFQRIRVFVDFLKEIHAYFKTS